MHSNQQQKRGRQAAWVITITLGLGCIVSQVERSAGVAAVFVAAALIEWRLAAFRERVEQHWANRSRSAVHPRMGS